MEKILFYHGGPGLNGHAENTMLTAMYRKADLALHTWDEPSALRNTLHQTSSGTRWEQWLKSAETFLLLHYSGKPLYLMGNSMGCQTISWLAQNHSEKVKGLIMSAPCFHPYKADQITFSLLLHEYEHNGDTTNAKKMQQILEQLSGTFGNSEAAGWQMALEQPAFFNRYWSSKEKQTAFFANYTEPRYGLDADSFFTVRKSYEPINFKPSSIKTIVLYGGNEAITDLPLELSFIQNIFTDCLLHKMGQSAHYPHIEEAEAALQLVSQFVKDK